MHEDDKRPAKDIIELEIEENRRGERSNKRSMNRRVKEYLCNKFFVCLHGDKTYNNFVCGNTT